MKCLIFKYLFLFRNFGLVAGDLSPFDFFRQETSNADVIVRTDAMSKIVVIAVLMGPDRARNDMLSYLQSKTTSKLIISVFNPFACKRNNLTSNSD